MIDTVRQFTVKVVHLYMSRQVADLARRRLDQGPALADSSLVLSITSCMETRKWLQL